MVGGPLVSNRLPMTSLSLATRDLNTRPVLGFDIGGTKCALSALGADGKVIELLRLPTRNFEETFEALLAAGQARVGLAGADVGISCGGPLDTVQGRILTPPNLSPDWYDVPIVERITSRWGGRAVLMNDANACALAEWTFGAGRGCRHMVFLTSGTGMGAGLILNGQLYEGATGDAGEIGHVRLRADGPLGYGKAGSVEGFTSGGGIARLAQHHLTKSPLSKPSWATHDDPLTLKAIADPARAGDAAALAILHEAGERLGETLAVLIDLFNPERIVLGGYFPRCGDLLLPSLQETLLREALPGPRERCSILPAELGETIGSHGAIAAALHAWNL